MHAVEPAAAAPVEGVLAGRGKSELVQEVVRPDDGARYDWQSDHILVKSGMQATGDRVTVVEGTLDPGFHLARHLASG